MHRNLGWLLLPLAPLALDSGNGALAISSSPPLLLDGASRVTSWMPSRMPAPDEEFLARIGMLYAQDPELGPALKQAFGGVYIVNEGFDLQTAQKVLDDGVADAVAFGKLAIANPDLVERFARGAPLNPWQSETFYSGGSAGYVDYSTLTREPA